MPYNFKTQEELKTLIYTGKVEEFKKRFEKIRTEDSAQAKEYLLGTKDEGRGLLSWASMQASCKELITYLINEAGADVNQRDGKGRTALLLSVSEGHLNNTKQLLLNKANPMIADRNEDTPLHVAAEGVNNTTAIIELLCTAKGAILSKNKQGVTPFHTAAKHSLEAMHALIKYKGGEININEKDNNGDTPLHYAATSETEGINVTYLLMLGADRTICNNDLETPAQTATNWDESGKDWQAIIGFAPRKGDNPEAFYTQAMQEEKVLLFGLDAHAEYNI